MSTQLPVVTALVFLTAAAAFPQDQNDSRGNAPIYRLTVVERTLDAVNYRYRNGPTKIDFRGTVLLPLAKGDAVVESKSGRTDIEAHFERLVPPTRYGNEYLAYVIWAITPEGHAKNLGEVIADGSNDAKIHVTTDLQAFGMLLTAEPYSAVRQPSDVVVLQNQIRPDTAGKVSPIQARAELLPRGHYTYNKPPDGRPPVQGGAKLSMDHYEALLEVYQAQNAVQIAGAMGAGKYAPETFGKAEQLLRTANDLQMRGRDRSTVVMTAREAAQTAEDARAIALARKQEEEIALARAEVANERQLRLQAEAEVQRARAEVTANREMLDAERVRARGAASGYNVLPAPPPVESEAVVKPPLTADRQQNEIRVRVLHDLRGAFPVLDSPRGLVVTVPDAAFRGSDLTPAANSAIERIAAVLVNNRGLVVAVEGHSDGSSGSNEQFTYARAVAIRDGLVSRGVPGATILARSLGASRPLVANSSATGREQNRRVEITISGEPIGSVPYWDKTYPLAPNR